MILLFDFLVCGVEFIDESLIDVLALLAEAFHDGFFIDVGTILDVLG
jgi:Co/Zn/Cd efflux system component